MEKQIIDLEFYKSVEPEIEFEIIPFQRLLKTINHHAAWVPHRTDFYQIILITEGQGTHTIDFDKFQYKRGALFSVMKKQIQLFEYMPKARGYVLIFTENFLLKDSKGIELISDLMLFNYLLTSPLTHLRESELEDLTSLIEMLKKELVIKKDKIKEEILMGLFKSFLLKAERCKRRQVSIKGIDKEFDIFIRFQNELDKHFMKMNNVSEYASILSISNWQLNQIVKNFLGKTAKQVINDRIILEIKRLLIHSGFSIKEMAYNLGFDEPTNLSKFFKRYTGLTPLQFKTANKI